MRFLDEAKQLYAYVKEYDANDIEREIRVLHFSQKTQSIKKSRLLVAKAMLDHSPALMQCRNNSLKLYRLMGNYFCEMQSDQEGILKGIACYYLMFDAVSWPENFNYLALLQIGEGFFFEHPLYAAFICWFLHKNINHEEILESSFLHQFFEYNACDIENVIKTYEWIAAFSEKGETFVHYLADKNCLTRGFANSMQESHYQSYNLLGKTYYHDTIIDIVNKRETYRYLGFFQQNFQLNGDVETLYFLFGGQLLRYLSRYENEICLAMLQALCVGQYGFEVLSQLAVYLVSPEAPFGAVEIVLTNLDVTEILKSLQSNGKNISALIEVDPFYLHAEDIRHFDAQQISDCIQKFTNNPKYHTDHHLVLLFDLLSVLSATQLLMEMNALSSLLVDIMFDLNDTLRSGMLEDKLERNVRLILPELSKRLFALRDNLLKMERAYINNEVDYFTFNQLWVSQLSQVNFLSDTYKIVFFDDALVSYERTESDDAFDFFKKNYPQDVYAFKSMAVHAYYQRCVLQNIKIDFSSLFSEMLHEKNVENRLIGEVLFRYGSFSSNDSVFIRRFLAFVFDEAQLNKVIDQKLSLFLVSKSIFFDAQDVFDFLLSRIDLVQFSVVMLGQNNWEMIEVLCGFSEKLTQSKIIERYDFSLFLKCLEYADTIGNLNQEKLKNTLSKKYSDGLTLFHFAARSGFYENVKKLFSLAEKYFLANELLMLLEMKNNAGEKPWARRSFPQSHEINRFFIKTKQALNKRMSIDRPRLEFLFSAGRSQSQGSVEAVRPRKRERSSMTEFPNTRM